ncbi:(E)-beta-ocimene synthase, chloroplastic [Artemisia annua]|uniref:(E)-beta-ocimene synthase, chloroplastic n=1 Tax=Artemisia annua TaxID=35608 RepID=A0A2U1LCX3_ARTAN|nr:(E)-beta-ocimene synthase, chloroplastic [Artemisia annua]
MLFRHFNDLAASSEVASEHIKTLIDKAWMKMIEAQITCSEDTTDPLIDMAINLARVSNCTYQYGDGIKAPEARIKDRERVTEREVKVAEMIVDYENGDFSTLELLELEAYTQTSRSLRIYEASREAKLFTTENLLKLNGQENEVMKDHINHALDIPLYRRMLRIEARWYMMHMVNK